jgi:hypothetical protein
MSDGDRSYWEVAGATFSAVFKPLSTTDAPATTIVVSR